MLPLVLCILLLPVFVAGLSDPERIAWVTGNLHRDADTCPPCFNCLLPQFPCENYGQCQSDTGRCTNCPAGFGGDNCGIPLCNHLGAPNRKPPPKPNTPCTCDDGWAGINCNVCQNDLVCTKLPSLIGSPNVTCYRGGIIVHQLFRFCEANLGPFYDRILKGRKIFLTMDGIRTAKNPKHHTIAFQAWLDAEEGFSCLAQECVHDTTNAQPPLNITYSCPTLTCKCITHASVCDPKQLLDLTPILSQIKGPATIACNENGTQCLIQEPQLSLYFSGGMSLNCTSGECVRSSQVPGHSAPPAAISTIGLISIILSLLLFFASLIYAVYYLFRRQQDMLSDISIRSMTPEEETRLFMETHIPANIVFKNLTYRIGSQHLILQSIYGAIHPGKVLAIMGGSGAGKTSLLDILAGKRKKGAVYGDILVNGAPLSPKEYRAMCGYVDQEDTLLDTLTVRETLTYSAMLRLPRTMSMEAKKLRVEQTMQELSIDHLADRVVGRSDARGISGGEKRRLSIAQELVTSPSILLLDEPTSGLDSYHAYHVMATLVKVAKRFQRTIICTIHQPRSDLFGLFDSVLLLSCGQVIYSGPSGDIPEYLDSIGLPCPSGYNMADHLLDITLNTEEDEIFTGGLGNNDRDSEEQMVSESQPLLSSSSERSQVWWADAVSYSKHLYSQCLKRMREIFGSRSSSGSSPQRVLLLERRAGLLSRNFIHSSIGGKFIADFDRQAQQQSQPQADGTPTPVMPVLSAGFSSSTLESHEEQQMGTMNLEEKIQTKIPFWSQVQILSGRTLINIYRNPHLLLAHYGLAVLLALFCGLLFFNITNDMQGVQNRLGCLFFICAFFGFGAMSSLEFFSKERVLFLRERSNGYYLPSAYYISKILFDLIPLRTVPPILFGSTVYFLIGLYPTVGAFVRFLVCLVVFNLVSASICLVVAVAFRQAAVANLTASLLILFSMLFAGFLLNRDRMLFLVSWIQYLSAFRYAYEALLVNELKDIQLHDDTIVDIDIPGVLILQQMGFDPNGYWKDIWMLLLMFLVCTIGAYLLLRFRVKEKK